MARSIIMLLTGITCVWIGGFLAGKNYSDGALKEYKAEQSVILSKAQKDHEKQLQQYINIGGEYYEKYINASNVKPVTITERVLIPADCSNPPQANTDRGLGDGSTTQGYARLHERNIERIRGVASRAETELNQCKIALESLIKKIEVHNGYSE